MWCPSFTPPPEGVYDVETDVDTDQKLVQAFLRDTCEVLGVRRRIKSPAGELTIAGGDGGAPGKQNYSRNPYSAGL